MIPNRVLAAMHARLTGALARPEGRYRPLWVERAVVGWLDDARAARLAAMTDVFDVRDDGLSFAAGIDGARGRSGALDRAARTLAREGLLTAWRDERYAVASEFGAPPWFELERAAARFFGIRTYAAHLNGLVRRDRGAAIWIARRSPNKSIDPYLLDNLVGGGIASGHTAASTLIKEAWEEAGLPAPIAKRAQPVGAVHVCRAQPDGLQRETIFVHDVWLSPGFTPANQDGEVAEFRLAPLRDVGPLLANHEGPDIVTADAALVMLDCLVRHGELAPDAPDYLALEALRHPPDSLAPAAYF